MTGGAADGSPAPQSPIDSLQRGLEIAGLVVAPTTLFTALLYYYAWVRTGALLSYFGVDQAFVGLSTTDYLLRGAGVSFLPVAAGLVLIAVLVMAHAVLRSGPWWINVPGWSRRIAPWLTLLVTGIGVAGLLGHTVAGAYGLAAVALALGVLAAEGLVTDVGRRRTGGGLPPVGRGLTVLRRGLVAAVVLVAAFWAAAVFAQQHGSRQGAAFARALDRRPSLVLFSQQRLQIAGPGVQVATLNASGAAYSYRYSGLRVLIRGDHRWVLLPAGWTRGGTASAVTVEDSGGIRVEFQSP